VYIPVFSDGTVRAGFQKDIAAAGSVAVIGFYFRVTGELTAFKFVLGSCCTSLQNTGQCQTVDRHYAGNCGSQCSFEVFLHKSDLHSAAFSKNAGFIAAAVHFLFMFS